MTQGGINVKYDPASICNSTSLKVYFPQVFLLKLYMHFWTAPYVLRVLLIAAPYVLRVLPIISNNNDNTYVQPIQTMGELIKFFNE